MADHSKIAWTEATWNPVTGCTKISPGCANCYAERMARRLQAMAAPRYKDGFAVRCHPEALNEPLRWTKPRHVFVCSMGDLFHRGVSVAFIHQVWTTMYQAPQHRFQILTKRAERMMDYFNRRPLCPWIWLGVTAEDQQRADERIPILLDTPAAVRFVSVEPMLEPVDLSRWLPEVGPPLRICSRCGLRKQPRGRSAPLAIAGELCTPDCAGYDVQPQPSELWANESRRDFGYPVELARSPRLDWVIVGGESGPKARPFDPAWARSVVQQCRAAHVPVFVKQLGSVWGRGMEAWPEDLWVREMPGEKP